MKTNYNKDLAAYKAAMRDMRQQKVNTEFISVRAWEDRIRPSEISSYRINGKPVF